MYSAFIPSAQPARERRGFTLTELIVCVAILAVLFLLAVSVTGRIRSAAASSECQGKLRQLGIAAKVYGTDKRGELPPAAFVNVLMPYVENQSPAFWCPADERVDGWRQAGNVAGSSTTSYAYNADLIGLATQSNRWGTQAWVRARTLPAEIEKPATAILFLDAGNYYCRRLNRTEAFRHSGGLNILYVDSHVARFSGDSATLYQDANWLPAP